MINKIQDICWDQFKGPYITSKEEIVKIINLLLSADYEDFDEDELDYILYNDFAGNIKHQYTIYNIIFPVLDFFDIVGKGGKKQLAYKLLDVFDYIFIEYYRVSTFILTEPVRFSMNPCNILEDKENIENIAFKKYKEIFKKNFLINELDYMTDLYYRTIFSDSIKEIEKIIYFDQESTIERLTTNLISMGITKFKYNNYDSEDSLIKILPNNQLNCILKAINHLPHDETLLTECFESNESSSFIWGRGSISLLAIDSFLIYNFNNDKKILSFLKKLPYLYEKWKNEYEKLKVMYELDFPLYKYIIEDITSIMFKEYLGFSNSKNIKIFTPVQRTVYDLLNYDLKIHSYSLLYAGIKPQKIDISLIENINDIYNCYLST